MSATPIRRPGVRDEAEGQHAAAYLGEQEVPGGQTRGDLPQGGGLGAVVST